MTARGMQHHAGAGSARRRRGLRGLAVCLATAVALVLPPGAAGAGSVYVAEYGQTVRPGERAQVSQYGIGAGGLLSALAPPTVATGSFPLDIVVSPDGRSAYVGNAIDNAISQYDIDPATGALAPKSPASVATPGGPFGLAVAPDGRSLYAAASTNAVVLQLDIDPQTGKLSLKSPAAVPARGAAIGIAVSPDGRSVYVANAYAALGRPAVSQYDVDPQSGRLSPKAPAWVDAPAGVASEFAVTTTPDGRSAYVTTDLGVLQYDVDPATGALSPKAQALVSSARSGGIAVSADGRSAYVTTIADTVTGTSAIAQYSVDAATGALTPKTPATVPAGAFAIDVAIGPGGATAYAANLGDNFIPAAKPGSVSQYRIEPGTGVLVPAVPASVPAGAGARAIAVGPLPAAVTYGSLCALTEQLWGPQARGQAVALCNHLSAAERAAGRHDAALQRHFLELYIARVQQAKGRSLTPAQAATLIAGARQLLPT